MNADNQNRAPFERCRESGYYVPERPLSRSESASASVTPFSFTA